MRVFISVIILLSLSLWTACETDAEIPFPAHEPALTLNSFLTEEGSFFLYITRSFGALEPLEPWDTTIVIRDAEVSLWKEGEKLADMNLVEEVIDTLILGNNPAMQDTFFSRIRPFVYLPDRPLPAPQIGETYEYVVNHPIYGSARVSNTVMPRPVIERIDMIPDTLISVDPDGYQYRWSAVKITLDDPGEVSNYYLFNGVLSFLREPGSSQDTARAYWKLVTEIEIDATGFISGKKGALSDVEFDGQRTTITAWVLGPNCCGYPRDFEEFPEIELLSLDLDAYLMDVKYGDYLNKLLLQVGSRTLGLESALIPREPVSVRGNVAGGYGLFGSFNYARFRVEL